MSCSDFYSVQALATPDNTKSIYWRMSSAFDDKGWDLEFYVDVSSESLGDWVTMNPISPVVDGCVFVDTVIRRYNMVSDIWYRVRAVLKDPDAIEDDIIYTSVPTQLMGALTDRAYLVGKTIVKAFYTKLKKGGGQQGFLLKRKIWGTRCPTCTDFDVETIINGSCQVCYGTGIIGGFYEGIEFWIMPTTVMNRARKPSEIGTTDDYSITAECVAYPWIDAYDIWVDAKTDERFLIKSINHVKELERKPIILNLTLAKIANTAIDMDIPIADVDETFENENEATGEVQPITDKFPVSDEEVIKSDEASTDKGWRRGLEGDDW